MLKKEQSSERCYDPFCGLGGFSYGRPPYQSLSKKTSSRNNGLLNIDGFINLISFNLVYYKTKIGYVLMNIPYQHYPPISIPFSLPFSFSFTCESIGSSFFSNCSLFSIRPFSSKKLILL